MESTRAQVYAKIHEFESKKTKEGMLQAKIYKGLICNIAGEACESTNKDANFDNSVSGFLTKAIISPLAHPPASGVEWTIAGLEGAGFIPQTYAAQGLGFTMIKPLSKLWTTLRDLAYIIMVVILVAISFMIMFRMKLNAQTVISIENALPRIVTSLILITFSFAIAGFLIDAMYFSITIIISIIAKVGNYDVVRMNSEIIMSPPHKIMDFIMGSRGFFNFLNLANIGYQLIRMVGPVISSVLIGLVDAFITFVWTGPFVKNFFIGDFFTNLIPEFTFSPLGLGLNIQAFKALIGGTLGAAVSVVIGGILTLLIVPLVIILIILITVVYLFFRIFFLLLDSYLRILLLVIFSPLIMMLDAIPGQSAFTFDAWIKNLIGELSTFPILVAIIGVGTIITDIPVPSVSPNPLNPGGPYLFAPPFLFGLDSGAFAFILGMTILFLTPDLITQFKKMIMPKALPIPEVGPGVFFGGAGAGLGGGIGEISKYGSLTHGVAGLQGIAKRFQIKIPGLT